MPAQPKRRRAPKPKPKAKAAPDAHALRAELARRLAAVVNREQWRTCRDRKCRRQRRCVPGVACVNPRPDNRSRPSTAEENARATAELRQAVRQRLAELKR